MDEFEEMRKSIVIQLKTILVDTALTRKRLPMSTVLANFAFRILNHSPMATLTRNITKGTNPMGKAELLLRLSVSRNLVVRLKTGLWMDPARFDKGVFSLPKDPAARAEIRTIEDRLIDIERFLINMCE